MRDNTRTVLIAVGVAVLVVVLLPLLFKSGMMAGMMDGGMTGGSWLMAGLLLVVLVAGVITLTLGLRRH